MTTDTTAGLLGLFNCTTKKEAKRYARDLTVRSAHLSDVLMAARLGDLEPYRYACRFNDIVPSHLVPTDEERGALAASEVGPLEGQALKMARKIGQLLQQRRAFAAHMLWHPTSSAWHLIYFDQRDMQRRSNHWPVGGSHIHYLSDLFVNVSAHDIWTKACSQRPAMPTSLHLRYERIVAGVN